MSISIIAAIGKNNELGKNNDLIWHFKEDMKFFKETTMGSSVIMGRKTFESLPKALPKRRNIVITSNPNYKAEGAEVVTSVDRALEAAGDDDVFIIGGGRVYAETIDLCDSLYLTEIEDTCDSAEIFFPYFDKSKYEKEIIKKYKSNGIVFSHIKYNKKGGSDYE